MTQISDSTKPLAPHGDDYDYDSRSDYDVPLLSGCCWLGYDHMEDARAASLRLRLPPAGDAAYDALAAIDRRNRRARRRHQAEQIRTLVKQAEKATGKPVTAITLPDGTKLDFEREQPSQGNEVDQWIARKHARAPEGH
jgi:hypothetical protein